MRVPIGILVIACLVVGIVPAMTIGPVLGTAVRSAVIVPAMAAALDRGIDIKVYYGEQMKTVTNTDLSDVALGAGVRGVALRPVNEPRLHAKLLAWDDDHLVVTSQNWLSADPSDANFRREIGLYIEGTGVARAVIERFEATRQYGGSVA